MDDLTSTTASAGAPDRARPNPRLDYALRRAASGDTEAFTRVYDATSSRVFGICLEMLRDRASAEEVTVETYVRVWATAGRFDPDREHAMSWILVIAHVLAVDRLRLVLPPVPGGRHLRVLAPPEAFQQAFDDIFSFLPAEATKPGHRWNREVLDPMPPFGFLRTTLSFQDDGEQGGLRVISCKFRTPFR